jgi:NAD+ kinase
MKKYAIVSRPDQYSDQIVEKLKTAFQNYMEYDELDPELVISVGGDGTMLYSVHHYEHLLEKVAFIGLHTGTLGFLTDYQMKDVDEFIDDVIHQEYTIYERHLLDIHTNKEQYFALNEVRIGNSKRPQVLDISINDEFFETFRGSGICICTASGSTAYNKSLGGAVVCSGVGIMQMSEMAGIHHNAYRSLGSSLILDSTHTVCIQSKNFHDSTMGIDHMSFDLKDVQYIETSISKRKARFARLKNISLIERLKRAFL